MTDWRKPTTSSRVAAFWVFIILCLFVVALVAISTSQKVTVADVWNAFPFLVAGSVGIVLMLGGYVVWVFCGDRLIQKMRSGNA